ncbi:zinc finger protein ZAT5 [Nicotiana tabacum]|uniref:Zinc finger protein ZAT5 n=1 Tax=Nicotiana tabacum TaxID=4097 RepID=A0A1S4B4T4_TOBAC|nr:PREDICTED: zinc finger protein ZAT5-like [Nicotiana tabacum]
MEFSEDSADRTLVFKGKRSKRPRQLSLVGMAVAVTSTSSTGGGGAGGGSDDIGGGGEFYSSTVQYSPTTSSTQISTSSEEDEDMANCLILLAQSGRCQKLQVESTERKMVKISSRKFTEMATSTTGGKAGFYVYECKTCNRTFPSFQALGGHRTSHKKAKTIVEEKKSTADSENHDRQYLQEEEKLNKIITPTQIVNKGNYSHGNLNSKPKIHECSICGAEFSSGQALGGHMRRHRPPPTITATNSTKVTDETTSESSHDDGDSNKEKPRIILSLDLNLPAPPEDDHRDSKFGFSANKQSLVFSAAALVDCHY